MNPRKKNIYSIFKKMLFRLVKSNINNCKNAFLMNQMRLLSVTSNKLQNALKKLAIEYQTG